MATTFTNGELAKINSALTALSQISLPVSAAFAVARSVAETAKTMETFDKVRMDLIKQHAEKDAEGEPRTENDEYVMTDRVAFDTDFETLLAQQTDVSLTTLKESDLRDISIAPAILVPLLNHVIVTGDAVVPAPKPAPKKARR